MLTPTLLPNGILATRNALFPANIRPPLSSSDVGAPAPQSVQTSSQRGSRPAPSNPITEGARGNIATCRDEIRANGSSGDPTAPTSHLATDPTPIEGQKTHPSQTEIAAIKRRCASGLLALVPRTIARMFFGVPSLASQPLYSADGTCSTNNSYSIATTSSPPSIGGDESLPQRPDSVSPSPSAILDHPIVGSESVTAERMRTDKQPVDTDPETVHLLETIEKDILDVFADEYCNKHLVYSIIEAVLAKVLPEMTERSVEGLMEDRGVAFAS